MATKKIVSNLLWFAAGLSAITSVSAATTTPAQNAVWEEMQYLSARSALLRYTHTREYSLLESYLDPEARKILVDALEDLVTEGELKSSSLVLDLLSDAFEGDRFEIEDRLRLFRLNRLMNKLLPDDVLRSELAIRALALEQARRGDLSSRAIAEIFIIDPLTRDPLGDDWRKTIARFYPAEAAFYSQDQFAIPSSDQIRTLFWEYPKIEEYDSGQFAHTPRLFAFCRHSREYPCLFALKDAHDTVYRRADGTPWLQPSLAMSSRGLPFNQRNGYTPQGIYRIDGVMPVADQRESFGRFRRLIINFIEHKPQESAHKLLIPESHHDTESWWHEAVIGRDIGRTLFRIHGSGKTGADPSTTWFPFYPTAGCVAQREGRPATIRYIDQRHLLDALMDASGLKVQFENEPKILGLLYLIEIDDRAASVEPSDLEQFGIF